VSSLGGDRMIVEAIMKESLAEGIRLAMLLAATLALAGAACAVFTIRPGGSRPVMVRRHGVEL
jgi:hypothetical protein